MTNHLHPFLLGIVVMASVSIGLFFYRFWRRSRDRLFVHFAVAFWLLAVNWSAQAFVPRDESYYVVIYLLRLLAFAVIIAGIIGKNRAARRGR
jgi:hypothetical protein